MVTDVGVTATVMLVLVASRGDTGDEDDDGDDKCQFLSHWYDLTWNESHHKRCSNPGSSALDAYVLTTRPTRRFSPSRWHIVQCRVRDYEWVQDSKGFNKS